MNEKTDKLLILDLDETLIHATEQNLGFEEDFKFEKYFVYKRPNLDEFLSIISKHFTVGIWSSADDVYVSDIVKKIKPENIEFEIVWGRSKCSLTRNKTFDNYYFEKRLDKLKKRNFKLDQIIIVEDTPEKSRNNYGMQSILKNFLAINLMMNSNSYKRIC